MRKNLEPVTMSDADRLDREAEEAANALTEQLEEWELDREQTLP